MRSTIPKKQEKKPPFFQGGPPVVGVASRDAEGAEPKTSATGSGHIRQGKASIKRTTYKTNLHKESFKNVLTKDWCRWV